MAFLDSIRAALKPVFMPNAARADYLNAVVPGVRMTASRVRNMRTANYALGDGADIVRDRRGRVIGGPYSDMGPRTWITRDIATLRWEGRMLARNNPHARFAVRTIVNWTIRTGINIKPKPKTKKTLNAMMPAFKASMVDTTEIDAARRFNFHGLSRHIMQVKLESGEVIVQLIQLPKSSGLTVPMCLKVMEPDYFYEGPAPRGVPGIDGLMPGNIFANGIELDPNGAPVAYWLYRTNPLDGGYGLANAVRVAKYDPFGNLQIIHLFDKPRGDMHRGFPRGAIVYQTLLNKMDYDQSILNRKQIDSKISHVLEADHSADPDDSPARNSDRGGYVDSEGNQHDGVPDAIPDGLPWEEAQEWANSIGANAIMDGEVVVTPPGYSYKPHIIQNFSDHPAFQAALLREVAVGFFAPEWLVTGDLRSLSYAGGELGLLSWKADCEAEQDDFIVTLVNPVLAAWTRAGNRANLWTDSTCEFTTRPDRFPSRDPGKDAAAIISKMNAGLMARRQGILELGDDPDEVEATMLEEVEWARKNKLPLEPGLYAQAAGGLAASNLMVASGEGVDGGDDANPDAGPHVDPPEPAKPAPAKSKTTKRK